MKMIASPQMSSDSHLASVMTQFGSILQFRSGEASSSFLLFRFLPWHSRMSGRKSRQTFLGKTPDSEDFLHWNLDPNWNDFALLNTYYVLGVMLGFGATAGPYSLCAGRLAAQRNKGREHILNLKIGTRFYSETKR